MAVRYKISYFVQGPQKNCQYKQDVWKNDLTVTEREMKLEEGRLTG